MYKIHFITLLGCFKTQIELAKGLYKNIYLEFWNTTSISRLLLSHVLFVYITGGYAPVEYVDGG